ncbi:MAG: hypothetical protein FWG14_06590 [Peptococcaceae bacterium]|nr:hypothetical protein [Peptococcaceae bacterium]
MEKTLHTSIGDVEDGMEKIFEKFSCINMMLVHHTQVDNFINYFKLKQVVKDINWSEVNT